MEALDAKWGNSDGEEDDKAHDSERSSGRPGKSKEDSEWVVLDMIDDNGMPCVASFYMRLTFPHNNSFFCDIAHPSPSPPTADDIHLRGYA